MSERLQPPFFFTNLTIENVRCFGERQELKLDDHDGRPAPWTLIVGDNGVGKTTLLQCLARMRPKFNPPPEDEGGGPPPNPIEPELATEEDNSALLALTRTGSDATAELRARMSAGQWLATREPHQPEYMSTVLSVARANGRIADVKSGGEPARVEFTEDVDEPLVLAYGAGRRPWLRNVDKDAASDPVESLFKVEAALHDPEELLYQLDYSSMKRRSGAGERLAGLRKILSAILPDVQDPGDIEIHGPPWLPGDSVDEAGIHVRTPYGTVPLSQLSLGYRTVFTWTVDIAWRLLQHNPNSAAPFDRPAIVIVDEIDLHLHPSWQRGIREHLTRHFPQIQFIATAHSPLMAQSSLDANVAVVRQVGDHAVIVNDPAVIESWRLDQLITSDLFDLGSARSPQVEKWQARRTELLDRPALSPEERAELKRLNRMVWEMPAAESADDDKAMEIIRRAAERLQSDETAS